jgi:hypothetical protein
MFDRYREIQFATYQSAREHFVKNPEHLIALEKRITEVIAETILSAREEIRRDYDEATYLFPFWQNYPPDERGRAPKGDQYPWIEVGEHALGRKLSRLLAESFSLRDAGLPTGPDERFVLSSPKLKKLTAGYTDSAWLFMDIKSVGPRDDFPHAVMSHNQVSGDGRWEDLKSGIVNTRLLAKGKISEHDFHCSVPPLYVLSDGVIAPVVHVVVKPVYHMLSLSGKERGQTLKKVVIASIPNGLLLTTNPNYAKDHPGLIFPGKDDKGKDPRKLRARVAFEKLALIDKWRVQELSME